MNFSTSAFVTSLITGSIGYVYFIYGKRRQRPLFMGCGILLSIFPFLVDSVPISVLVGVILTAVPPLAGRYLRV